MAHDVLDNTLYDDDATTSPVANAPHVPVMLETCLQELQLADGDWVIDGTFGAGGHSRALLASGAHVLAIDQDINVKDFVKELAIDSSRFRFKQGNFRHLDSLAHKAGVTEVSAILLDLGVSSMQLDEADRGFAFRHNGPLDMRMSGDSKALSAADIVNSYAEDALATIIYRYGEERFSRRIAKNIVAARQVKAFESTQDLVDVISASYPKGQHRRDHPARRTFQALRIHVNDELGALKDALAAAAKVLKPGGRLVVMSYHSLEDRIVKHFIKEEALLQALYKKPLLANEQELAANPRARSAKLRVAEKIVGDAPLKSAKINKYAKKTSSWGGDSNWGDDD